MDISKILRSPPLDGEVMLWVQCQYNVLKKCIHFEEEISGVVQ